MSAALDIDAIRTQLKQLIKTEQWQQALDFLTVELQQHPDNAQLHIFYVEILNMLQQPNVAMKHLRQVFSLIKLDESKALLTLYQQIAAQEQSWTDLVLSSIGVLSALINKSEHEIKALFVEAEKAKNISTIESELLKLLNTIYEEISLNKLLFILLPLLQHNQKSYFSHGLQALLLSLIIKVSAAMPINDAYAICMQLYNASMVGYGAHLDNAQNSAAAIEKVDVEKQAIQKSYAEVIQAWAAEQKLTEQLSVKKQMPYRLAYLLSYGNADQTNSLLTLVVSRLRGQLELNSGQFTFYLYTLGKIQPWLQALAEKHQNNLVIKSFFKQDLLACYQTIRADNIDILFADHFMGLQTALFQCRVAPIQGQILARWSDNFLPNLDVYTTCSISSKTDLTEAVKAWPYLKRYQQYDFIPTRHYVSQALYDKRQPIKQHLIEQERAKFPTDKLLIGCYARLEKFSDAYLTLCAKILKKFPEVYLLLAGNGEVTRLYDFFAEHDLLAQVSLINEVVPGAVYSAVFDVVLDPFPHGSAVALFEFMHRATPVIHRRDAKVMDHKEALKVPELVCADDDAVLAVLQCFVSEPDFKTKMQAKTKQAFIDICAEAKQQLIMLESNLIKLVSSI